MMNIFPHRKVIALSICLGIVFTLENVHANQQVQQEVIFGADIPKFVEPLPIKSRVDGTKKLKVYAEEFQQKILPDSFYASLPSSVVYKSVRTGYPEFVINPRKGTYNWGYKINDGEKDFGPSFPAHTIEAKQGHKTKVEYINRLCPFKDKKGRCLRGPLLQKFLTTDLSFQWANPLNWPQYGTGFDTYDPIVYPFGTGLPQGNPGIYTGPQPMVVHLHGSETPSFSDGDPDSWFTPNSEITGASYVTNKYVYPNTQPSVSLWFHDHVIGETRLNIFAGLAGFYLIRGEPESLVTPPLPAGKYDIELAISDRQFDTYGQLFFPDGDPLTAGLNGPPGNPDINPYAIPEFFGDVICVNGRSWPYLEVEPRRYRFRLLNASNARMYGLFLTNASGPSAPDIWQISTDGGLLDSPVNVNFVPFTFNPTGCSEVILPPDFVDPTLFLAPAERADIIIDFSGFEGQTLILNNDSVAPFPSGGTELDPAVEGLVMQFRVKTTPVADPSFNPVVDHTLRSGSNEIVRLVDGAGGLAPGVVINQTRSLILIEQEDPFSGAPVVVLLNNTTYDGKNPYNDQTVPDSVPYNKGSIYVTELPQVGSTELWEIVNMTPDAHPIHIHLIQFQLMNRQVYNIGRVVPPFNCPGSYRNAYEALWSSYTPPTPPDLPPGTVYSYGPPLPYLSTPKLGGNPDVFPYLFNGGAGPLFTCNVVAPYGCVYPPDPNEYGWKDTMKMYPGTVTRLIIRWSPQTPPVGGVSPGQNLFAFDPTAKLGVKNDGFGYPGGSGYVWHCHISDHEDNMMMRPFEVINTPQRP